jgi:hypothetical protein
MKRSDGLPKAPSSASAAVFKNADQLISAI